jgi:hypothetical protein
LYEDYTVLAERHYMPDGSLIKSLGFLMLSLKPGDYSVVPGSPEEFHHFPILYFRRT